MRIALPFGEIRSWEAADVESLARHANNEKIAINTRDRFPFPYTRRDARAFVRTTRVRLPETSFAIAVGGEAVGGIGIMLQPDIERVSAEIGYWLGEQYWGRGIATAAVKALTAHAIREHGLTRVYARVASWNTPSCRVLEKAGYRLEATLRRSAIKNGTVIDQHQYAFVVPADPPPPGSPG
jgi:RimJ/RimL family protein N-acetyltransferase